MGKYLVEIKETAKTEILKIKKSGNIAAIKKLEKIISELEIHPTIGIGNPEQLKFSLVGFWSRRLSSKDRLIYEIIEEPERLVVIVSALGHYSDK